MIKRLRVFIVVASAIGYACASQAKAQTSDPGDARVMWVAQAMMRMLTIKPGMTRGDLLKVFTVEGGISTRFQRTYISRDCPYFKVDVEFKEVGPPGLNGDQMQFGESSADILVKISRPYLAFSILD
jgi:hypothetical protein